MSKKITQFLPIFQNEKSSSPTKTDGGTSALIMPQKKPKQPNAAQDGVRSDLLKAIRDGKCISTFSLFLKPRATFLAVEKRFFNKAMIEFL